MTARRAPHRLHSAAALTALIALAMVRTPSALAAMNQLDATIDLRAVATNAEPSFLGGGLGTLRFDDEHRGLRVGELRLGYTGQFADIVHVNVEAVNYADGDRLPLDLTEANIEIRPFPRNAWRSRVKIGAFYAPISFENRLQGWRPAYSLTPSAINSWIGEELRTIGAEYDLDWLGRQRGHDWEFGVGAALYGWNDTTGTELADRGWALDDRQTPLFGDLGRSSAPTLLHTLRPFYYDTDHRAGYYVDGSAKYLDDLELRTLYYDNRGNTGAYDPAIREYAWHTWFDSAGARWNVGRDWTVIGQWLEGHTCVLTTPFCWQYDAAFLLTSWQAGPNMLSARYDNFQMHMDVPVRIAVFGNRQRGSAWTLAYEHDLSRSLSVLLEAIQIEDTLSHRTELNLPPGAVERMVQLAVRWDLDWERL